MVCKRSSYCLKYGPCANDETRKQIWEDNIKFREHFKAANQSDHYWSFQVLGQSCSCCEMSRKPYLRRTRYSSLQALDKYDCCSVTHDQCNIKSDTPPCPLHSCTSLPTDSPPRKDVATETASRTGVDKSVGLTPIKPMPNVSLASEYELPSRYLSKPEKVCPRFRSSLNSKKDRFTSQPNLLELGKHSCSDAQFDTPQRRPTVSRTTRQSLISNKAVPFLPCGDKQTHNVLATGAVYPSAVNAKHLRQQNIKKLLRNEEQLQIAEQNNFKKRVVNHSSLWTTEYNRSYRDTGDPFSHGSVARVSTPMPRRPAMQPVRAVRRSSSQVGFY